MSLCVPYMTSRKITYYIYPSFTTIVKPYLFCCFGKVISEDVYLFHVISDSLTFVPQFFQKKH